MQIEPLSKCVGAEIKGVDVAQLSDADFEKIEDAYNGHSVLVFRDQKLTPEQHIAFARRFGDLEISPRTQFALPGHPEVLVLSNIIENGKPIGNADTDVPRTPTCPYTPDAGTPLDPLRAANFPIENSRTLGGPCSPAPRPQRIAPRGFGKLCSSACVTRGRAAPGGVAPAAAQISKMSIPKHQRPVIRTSVRQQAAEQSMCARANTCAIRGMPERRAPAHQGARRHGHPPDFCYRHRSRLGDLLMWDNSMTQHLAISDYALPLRRLMHRVTMNGTVPI